MENKLQDLKTAFAEAKSPVEFIELAWSTSAKNAVAHAYVVGVIDALRYAKVIDLETYNRMYDTIVYAKAR